MNPSVRHARLRVEHIAAKVNVVDRLGTSRMVVSRGSVARLATVCAAFSLLLMVALVPDGAAAANGDLVQKKGAAACLGALGPCTPAGPLDGAFSVAVSPDGKSAYVASSGDDALTVFDRNAGGSLRQKAGAAGCVSESGAGVCVAGRALSGAGAVVVSPDGRSVYVASHSALAVFDRAAGGSLIQKPSAAGCFSVDGEYGCAAGNAIDHFLSIAVSPDGRNAYVASTEGAVAIFDRAPDGTLAQKAEASGCVTGSGFDGATAVDCTEAAGLENSVSVTVSPEGRNVYVAGGAFDEGSDAVAIFDRGSDGSLLQKAGSRACIAGQPGEGCSVGRQLSGAAAVTVSPDGENAYVASSDDDAIAVLDRDRTGALTQKATRDGCVSDTRAEGCTDGRALDGVFAVAVSPDGRNVYSTGGSLTFGDPAAGAVAVFDRAADGALAQKSGSRGCISHAGVGACTPARALIAPRAIVLSPAGENAYVASSESDALAIFDRAGPPPRRGAGVLNILATRVELAVRNRVTVGCKVTSGARIRSCSVRLIALGTGAKSAQRISIGRGRTTLGRPGRGRMRVRIRLNQRGRRLIRRALDGVSVRIRARATRYGAPLARAVARTRVIARRQRIAPRRGVFAPGQREPNAYGERFLASIARGAGHLARVVCIGYTARRHARAIRLARARGRSACRRLRQLGISARTRGAARIRKPTGRGAARNPRGLEILLSHRH